MCYNVLCDKYCTRQLYGYCPTWALNWDYRKKGIIEEIHSCAADIICLQIDVFMLMQSTRQRLGVIEYLTSGKVAANHGDFKEIGYGACLQKVNLNKTNFTYDFKGIIDYIFYSRDFMNLLGLLGPLDQEWFSQNKIFGCPHPHVPSDHFSLFVEFEMPVPLHNLSNPSGNRGGNQRETTGGSFNKMR